MAPLTGYRRWFDASAQLRTNSWMLMTGSLGMLASTLPVQWLMPIWGWRPLFVALGLGIALAMLLIVWQVPRWQTSPPPGAGSVSTPQDDGSYAEIWRSRYFWRMAPVGFFSYGGLVAIQTLWAGPWMTQVAGWTPIASATGLFAINLSMLVAFWVWGWITPALSQRGIRANRLIAWGMPLNFLSLAAMLAWGPDVGPYAAAALSVYCVTSTFISLAQPAVGMAFAPHLAGRALSAYNLVIFAGVFVVQWGIGLMVDLAASFGLGRVASYQAAFAVFGACSFLSWLYFLLNTADNEA